MAKGKRTGVCCICGNSGDLSFEHVPPKSAYNKETVIAYEWEEFLQQRKSKKKTIQGGAGDYTLCERCNNNTGSWYGDEYVTWARSCHDVMMIWQKHRITQGIVTLKDVYPLRFLKQVVTCFFSLIGAPGVAAFANNNPDLVQFVLDKYNTNLPPGFRFFMNLYMYSAEGNTSLRRWAGAGKISIQMHGIDASIIDEIAHPPFQLVMTEDNDPFNGATEITEFRNFAYDDQVNLKLALRVVSSDSPYPSAG